MNFFRRAPLFVILLITIGIMTGAAVYGRNTSYQEYEENPVQKPVFSVVLQGMHDGVFPWGRQESAAEREARELLADGAAGTDTSGTNASGTMGTDNGTDAGQAGALDETGAGEQNSTASSDEIAGDAQSEDARSDRAEDSSAADGKAEEVAGTAGSATPEPDLTIPEGVNSEVLPAKDYGNNDSAYLTPDGQTWEKDTTGIFASNGTYYYLQAVDDGYFQDAIFIGDSRTEGLYVYSSLRDKTTFDAKDSLTIFKIYDTSLDYYGIDGTTGSKTAMEALQEKQYRKVYFSVGINELGMPTDKYFDKYKEFIQVIRQLQPDAIIYIEGIMHVTGDYAQRNSVYNNVNIVDKNTALCTLANGHDIFYLDMNSAVCDANGEVPADMSYDGVHLKASAYEKWHQFLKDHAIVREDADWTPEPTPTPTPEPTTAPAAAEETPAATGTTAQSTTSSDTTPSGSAAGTQTTATSNGT